MLEENVPVYVHRLEEVAKALQVEFHGLYVGLGLAAEGVFVELSSLTDCASDATNRLNHDTNSNPHSV